MKIGIDCRLWNETGVGRYIRNLVFELSRIDKENKYFLFIQHENQEVGKTLPENFKLIPVDIHWHTLKEQLRYARFLEEQDLDLVHFPYFSLPLNYKGKFVLTIHDLIIHHFSTGKASTLPLPIYHLKRLAYLFLIQKASKKASKIIAVSESTKIEILDHLGVSGAKVKVIYEGVDSNLKNVKGTSSIKDPFILYVGNSYPHKNLERLIQGFELARDGNEKLVLVGKENFFYRRLKEKYENRVKGLIFLGEVDDSELSSLYANANAFVMPSLMEGFGLPPLEAMANNCFVIAANIPSLKEICQDAAVYFNPYDTSDLSDKIKLAFRSGGKKEYLEKGLLRASKFSWTEMARETLKLYESSV